MSCKPFFLIGRNFKADRDGARVTAKAQHGKSKAMTMQFVVVFTNFILVSFSSLKKTKDCMKH